MSCTNSILYVGCTLVDCLEGLSISDKLPAWYNLRTVTLTSNFYKLDVNFCSEYVYSECESNIFNPFCNFHFKVGMIVLFSKFRLLLDQMLFIHWNSRRIKMMYFIGMCSCKYLKEILLAICF